jgi:putative mRNA 3-end processing factor
MIGDLLQPNENGLYCPQGDFYIDPWRAVERAVITHGHSDHARPGSRRYLTTPTGAHILRARLDASAHIRALPLGETLEINGVRVSLHPAGHILGSAQVRIEWRGQVWVVSGDYKTVADPTCEAFAAVGCHVFITESTFGLPIYRWRPQHELIAEINDWWRNNRAAGRTSVLYAYALGKAQRILAGLDPSIGPILVHGAVYRYTQAYLRAGIVLPAVLYADTANARAHRGQALVLAPPSADAMSGWLAKFGDTSLAFASGWMQIRGARRRRAVDRGFVVSDHADWPGLLDAIRASGAARIGVTHGYTTTMVRYLREQGWAAEVFESRYTGEGAAEEAEAEAVEDNEVVAADQTGDSGAEFAAAATDDAQDL